MLFFRIPGHLQAVNISLFYPGKVEGCANPFRFLYTKFLYIKLAQSMNLSPARGLADFSAAALC